MNKIIGWMAIIAIALMVGIWIGSERDIVEQEITQASSTIQEKAGEMASDAKMMAEEGGEKMMKSDEAMMMEDEAMMEQEA